MLCASWKKLTILILLAISSLGVASCDPKAPPFKTPLRKYATDSKTQQVFRKTGKDTYEQILTSDPRFNQMQCYWNDEVQAREKEAIDLSYKCKEWEQ